MFHLAEREHGNPLTDAQERAVAMLIYEDPTAYEEKVRRLEKQGLTSFTSAGTLGTRMAGLQPFQDASTVPSLSPLLAATMGIEAVNENPLVLLREYSNFDKHRAIRVGAARTLVQRPDDWRASLAGGMRPITVGTVLDQVKIGVYTPIEISPALVVARPDGTWVAFGPELDGIAKYISDIAIPTLVTGIALTGGLPVDIDLTDNGQTLEQRAAAAGTDRAHERARPVMFEAFLEAQGQDERWPDIATAPDTEPTTG